MTIVKKQVKFIEARQSVALTERVNTWLSAQTSSDFNLVEIVPFSARDRFAVMIVYTGTAENVKKDNDTKLTVTSPCVTKVSPTPQVKNGKADRVAPKEGEIVDFVGDPDEAA